MNYRMVFSMIGRLLLLEAALLLVAAETTGMIRTQLEEALSYTRYLLGQEVLEQPIVCKALGGMDEKQIRERSHRPQDFYGKPHFMPEPEDGPAIAALNRARCAARAAELQGVDTFSDRDGCPTRPDIVQALNRMSSMLYILMIREKARQGRK